MAILYVIFFFAGASSLAYQIIWIRLFGLIFGGTEISMSVVVAVFMGGLALGSYVIGNYAVTSKNRVRLFGYLEIALGLLAILVFFGIPVSHPLFTRCRLMISIPLRVLRCESSCPRSC